MKNQSIFLCLLLLILIYCRDTEADNNIINNGSSLKMKYTELNDVSIPFDVVYSCDADGDGKRDFYISSVIIGKPSEQSDYYSYFISGGLTTSFLVNNNEQTPVLSKLDAIGKDHHPNENWYNASQLALAEKVNPLSGNSYWVGNWKDVSHQYLAFSLLKDNKVYYGWLELSVSKETESVILHRMAVSLDGDKVIIAGK